VLSLVWVAVDSTLALAGGIVGGSFLLVGVVLLFAARYVGSLDTSGVLRDGVRGTATVLSTRDTGVTINNLDLVVELRLRVTPADIVAAGVQTTGQVVSVQPLGVTTGQLTAGLPADQADDSVVHVVFTFVGPGGEQRRKEALIRVPDGKQGVLAPGRPVAVSYLAETPDTATIDWSRT